MDNLKRKFTCLIGLIFLAFIVSFTLFDKIHIQEKNQAKAEEVQKDNHELLNCAAQEDNNFFDQLSVLLEQPQTESCLFVGCSGFF